MTGYVYIRASKPLGTLYVGVTADIGRRDWEHRSGIGSRFVARYDVQRLVYVERHDDIRTAIAREKAIKHWKRAWKVRLIESINPSWRDMAEDGLF